MIRKNGKAAVSMDNFGFEEMQNIQRELQEKYAHKWDPLSPKKGRDLLLWMMIEAGEVADIIKKKGDDAIMENPEVRHGFTEELCDVLMYLNDVMLCYGITPEELKTVYLEKHKRNMGRW
jgi:NTP pyrophosphatase (non-canonical NTP hydrolase)